MSPHFELENCKSGGQAGERLEGLLVLSQQTLPIAVPWGQ